MKYAPSISRSSDVAWRDERAPQLRVGLHDVGFRARERADVDAVHELLVGIGANVIHSPADGPWVPGDDSVLFEETILARGFPWVSSRVGSGGAEAARCDVTETPVPAPAARRYGRAWRR